MVSRYGFGRRLLCPVARYPSIFQRRLKKTTETAG
jgi:hypothetical protein